MGGQKDRFCFALWTSNFSNREWSIKDSGLLFYCCRFLRANSMVGLLFFHFLIFAAAPFVVAREGKVPVVVNSKWRSEESGFIDYEAIWADNSGNVFVSPGWCSDCAVYLFA